MAMPRAALATPCRRCPGTASSIRWQRRRGRPHGACGFPGAARGGRERTRARARPAHARRVPAPARDRGTRRQAESTGDACAGQGHRRRARALDRSRANGHGRTVQGHGVCPPSAGRAARIRNMTAKLDTHPRLQAASLAALAGIRHAFFTRDGGVSDGIYASLNGGQGSDDAAAHVTENRARMAAALGVAPARFITAYQVHSPDVVVAEEPWTRDTRPQADAIVTRVPGLGIGVSTADCGPVLLADADARVIAAAHAGWRGALTGVIEAAVAAMERLGATRTRMVATIALNVRQANAPLAPLAA